MNTLGAALAGRTSGNAAVGAESRVEGTYMSLRNFSTAGGLLIVAGVLLGACVSTEETNSGPQYKYPTESSFCSALAKADCTSDVVKACYSTDNADNKASCVAARSQTAACRASVTGVETALVSYNPQTAEACIAKHASIYADAELTRDEMKAATDACIKTFSGSGGPGSGCSIDFDCDTNQNLRCIVKVAGTMGTCAVAHPVKLGDFCPDPADQCDDDQFCGKAVSGQICQKRIPAGNPCAADAPCDDASKCVIDAMTMMGTCQAKVPDAQPCTADEDCAGTFCEIPKEGTDSKCASVYEITRFLKTCDGFLQ
jgi:hypothetical protein